MPTRRPSHCYTCKTRLTMPGTPVYCSGVCERSDEVRGWREMERRTGVNLKL